METFIIAIILMAFWGTWLGRRRDTTLTKDKTLTGAALGLFLGLIGILIMIIFVKPHPGSALDLERRRKYGTWRNEDDGMAGPVL